MKKLKTKVELTHLCRLSLFVQFVERLNLTPKESFLEIKRYNDFLQQEPDIKMFVSEDKIFSGWELKSTFEDYIVNRKIRASFMLFEKQILKYKTLEEIVNRYDIELLKLCK